MKKGMTLLKKFLPLIIILIFVIPLILVGVNYTKYDCIILSKEPDGIFSSAYTNKLAVITDGQLRIYDENGKYRDIKTAFRVTYAYPLEDTAWLIDDNDNLYELNYKYTTETTVSEVVLQNIKSFFGTPRQFAAIDNNGDLYVWGDNGQSLLGIDGEEYIEKPMKADYIKNVKKVAFGNLVTLLLTENGDVYEAGVYKFQDEVSADKPIYITSFTKIEVLSDITDICMGEDVFAVCNDKVVEWGYGYVGLDNNMASFCHKEGLKNFSISFNCCLGMNEKGDVFYWGTDILGKTKSKDTPWIYTPIEVIKNADNIYAAQNVGYVKKGLDIIILKRT